MKLIETRSQLLHNIKTLQSYLSSKVDPEYSYTLNLVKKGICFVAIISGEEYQFYPSRFIGYTNNTMDDHENNECKDGRETNPAISKILGEKPVSDLVLDEEYKKHCETLGFVAFPHGAYGGKRKFWVMSNNEY